MSPGSCSRVGWVSGPHLPGLRRRVSAAEAALGEGGQSHLWHPWPHAGHPPPCHFLSHTPGMLHPQPRLWGTQQGPLPSPEQLLPQAETRIPNWSHPDLFPVRTSRSPTGYGVGCGDSCAQQVMVLPTTEPAQLEHHTHTGPGHTQGQLRPSQELDGHGMRSRSGFYCIPKGSVQGVQLHFPDSGCRATSLVQDGTGH